MTYEEIDSDELKTNPDILIRQATELYDGVAHLLEMEEYEDAGRGLSMIQNRLRNAHRGISQPGLRKRIQRVYNYLRVFRTEIFSRNPSVVSNAHEKLSDQLSILWHLTN